MKKFWKAREFAPFIAAFILTSVAESWGNAIAVTHALDDGSSRGMGVGGRWQCPAFCGNDI